VLLDKIPYSIFNKRRGRLVEALPLSNWLTTPGRGER
jgi:hypothetical protein